MKIFNNLNLKLIAAFVVFFFVVGVSTYTTQIIAKTTISYCHVPADDISKSQKHIDEPEGSWSGHAGHALDFIINNQTDENLCDAIIAGSACADYIDNDSDGLIDANDPGCWTDPTDSSTYDPSDNNETDPVVNTAPVITLNGSNPDSVTQGSGAYSDAGATCTDAEDTTPPVVSVTGSVDTTTIDTYTLTYSCTDTGGKTATTTRTVSVVAGVPGNTAPVAVDDIYSVNEDDTLITVQPGVLQNDTDPNSGDTLTATKTIDPLHGTATIALDGSFTYIPNLNYNGSDTFSYTVSDGKGGTDTASVMITVNAVNDLPTISLNGNSTISLTIGGSFTDPGATCADVDLEDAGITAGVTGIVNTAVIDNYTLSYQCTDTHGGTSTTVTRTVSVVAAPVNNAPVIAVNGDATVDITEGDTYVDAGASCTDPESGTLTVTTSGSVDTSIVSTYTITYSCTDGVNTSTATRTVNVNPANVTPVLGCTDSAATNYNANATQDDGSCTFPPQITDVCPNITGTQASIPSGYKLNSSGDCVKKTSSGGGYIGSQQPVVGEVLGAQTSCGIYVDKYLKKGLKGNDKSAVSKVQQFLNDFTHTTLTIDGIFGGKTEAALKAFQFAHKDKILDPWKLTQPTGIFYLTTQTEVNNIMCPDLALPIPQNLIPFSANPNTPKI